MPLIKELYNSNKPVEGKVYYTQYVVKVIGANNKVEQESTVDMYLTNHQRQIITEAIHLYVDSVYTLTIIPVSKTIVVNYLDNKTRAEYKKMATASLDSLFLSTMKQESCKYITGNAKYTKEVVLVAKDKSASVKKVKYLIDEQKKVMYKMSMYAPDLISRMEYTYTIIDFDYKGKSISDHSVLDMAFKQDGSLLPQYKGYQVTDNRTKTSKNIKQ